MSPYTSLVSLLLTCLSISLISSHILIFNLNCFEDYFPVQPQREKNLLKGNNTDTRKKSTDLTIVSLLWILNRHLPTGQIFRSSHSDGSVKKVFLKISQNLQENICVRVSFSKLQASNSLKKRFWHNCFPVNFAKFFKKTFLQNTSGACF